VLPVSQQNKNNPEKLAIQVTQDEEKQNKNNPEKLATQVTQDEEKQNKNNQEKDCFCFVFLRLV
jgi:hypothetical protein